MMERSREMKLFLHKHYLSAAALLCLILLFVFSSCAKNEVYFSKTGFAMGSAVSTKIYAESEAEANKISEEIFAAIGHLDSLISTTDKNSEIAVINAKGKNTMSKETVMLLKSSLVLCEKTDGKLDITLGAVTKLWGFSSDTPSVPDEKEIKAALNTVGLNNIDINGYEVKLLNGAEIDLGAIGKGAGIDEAAKVLQNYSGSAVISFGGTVLIYGNNTRTVGIRDPYGTGSDYCGILTLTPKTDALCVSTSGSYEKAFTENGVTYHHILDPQTGYPVKSELVSVTAIAESGTVCDALSTLLFAEGLTSKALELAHEYLLGAVFIFADGRVYVTGEEIKDCFELTNTENYTLINDEEISY